MNYTIWMYVSGDDTWGWSWEQLGTCESAGPAGRALEDWLDANDPGPGRYRADRDGVSVQISHDGPTRALATHEMQGALSR